MYLKPQCKFIAFLDKSNKHDLGKRFSGRWWIGEILGQVGHRVIVEPRMIIDRDDEGDIPVITEIKCVETAVTMLDILQDYTETVFGETIKEVIHKLSECKDTYPKNLG